MTTASRIQPGYFIIADISGYTSFLHGSELDHAHEILEALIKLMVRHVQAPSKLVELEGDAVFSYVPAESLPEPERLVEQIEATYWDFVNYLRDMKLQTTCTCRACSTMGTLDLKFFVHYGEYIIQKLDGIKAGIVGPDVILVHRLMKNSVTEKLGLRGYALFTEACLAHMNPISNLTTHSETYEHIGEVKGFVYDLQAYAQTMRESSRVYINPAEADYIYERVVPLSPDMLWSYIVEPQKRLQWQAIRRVENKRNSSGRMGVNGEFHCDHGSFSRISRMVDWRPFQYMTNITVQTFHRIPWKGPPNQVIYEFFPIDTTYTRVSFRIKCLQRDWLTMMVFRSLMKKMLDKENNADFDRLDKLVNDRSSA